MIPTFFLGLLGKAAPDWLKGPLKWLADALILLAILGLIYAFIYHRGSVHGAAKAEAKIEKAHAQTVAEAKADSVHAQTVTDKINDRVTHSDNMTTDLVRSKIKEIDDALDTTPGAAAGAVPVFDGGGVRASLNALVDSANRAADLADAKRGTGQDGAPVANQR